MKQIRKNVFETNSSSIHSLSISDKDNYDYTQLFGALGLVGIMYCEQDKKFDANDLSQFEIIDEISLQ